MHDVMGGFVALESWVAVGLLANEAELASQHQQGSVDDGEEETFPVGDGVADGVQTAVHACGDVTTVGGLDGHGATVEPLEAEQA